MKKRFRKVVKWENEYNKNKPWTDKSVLVVCLVCAIPYLGLAVLLLMFIDAWVHRKVYFEEE